MDEQQVENGEQEETDTEAEAVDLNRVFREEERDLNSMFPDGEMRKFLRQVKKNRRGNERFLEGIKREKLWQEDD
ncbi:MAG: hypothetical protein PVG64_07665 [Syntrophobacterales bacterium]|jgi:hypothetical protein|nr:MAG: hypothetical protein JSV47_13735 [Deltaproteobacteria bacterium]